MSITRGHPHHTTSAPGVAAAGISREAAISAGSRAADEGDAHSVDSSPSSFFTAWPRPATQPPASSHMQHSAACSTQHSAHRSCGTEVQQLHSHTQHVGPLLQQVTHTTAWSQPAHQPSASSHTQHHAHRSFGTELEQPSPSTPSAHSTPHTTLQPPPRSTPGHPLTPTDSPSLHNTQPLKRSAPHDTDKQQLSHVSSQAASPPSLGTATGDLHAPGPAVFAADLLAQGPMDSLHSPAQRAEHPAGVSSPEYSTPLSACGHEHGLKLQGQHHHHHHHQQQQQQQLSGADISKQLSGADNSQHQPGASGHATASGSAPYADPTLPHSPPTHSTFITAWGGVGTPFSPALAAGDGASTAARPGPSSGGPGSRAGLVQSAGGGACGVADTLQESAQPLTEVVLQQHQEAQDSPALHAGISTVAFSRPPALLAAVETCSDDGGPDVVAGGYSS
ncbi:hypothetical protein DUNSADRAFT_3008, partial [Dunaliella salina]